MAYNPGVSFFIPFSDLFAPRQGCTTFPIQVWPTALEGWFHALTNAHLAINWPSWKKRRFASGFSLWIHVEQRLGLLLLERWLISCWLRAVANLRLRLARIGHQNSLNVAMSFAHAISTIWLPTRIQRRPKSPTSLVYNRTNRDWRERHTVVFEIS